MPGGSSFPSACAKSCISAPISKLLARLETLGLIENTGAGHLSGEPNAWQLTAKGEGVAAAIQMQTAR